ncbi:MAG: hypothetical protein VYE73_00340 [Acidobacteriota bacterium]|nr:hypothetical protein [Acidobacteriota bacterium]
MLGVEAAIGHALTPEDDLAPGAHPVVVLGIAEHVREQDLENRDPQAELVLVPTSEVLLFPSFDRWASSTLSALKASLEELHESVFPYVMRGRRFC